ncbi:endoribonuclease dicer homolog 3a [Phtheirospermum japonicum]|uniref:Endoribonuclease dicer homolog 3a n=1 Tax=Phtheirospermum japonicum TaxID=374723 RepID=A0A830C8T8_9LAMI|nr:endoribonuclease dicer homolog 3a [Phtheirospermum japonicum]
MSSALQTLILTRPSQSLSSHTKDHGKTTRTKIPRTPAKISTTSSPAASQNDPSSGSIDPIFHFVRTFPFSFLRLRRKLPSFTLPSTTTVYSIILLTYFMVVSGIVYDVIVEPPGIGSTQYCFTGAVKPVVFLPGRVHGQYIIEGLSSGFMFVLGSVGIMLLDLALDKNWAKSVKVISIREIYDGQLFVKLKKGFNFPAMDPWIDPRRVVQRLKQQSSSEEIFCPWLMGWCNSLGEFMDMILLDLSGRLEDGIIIQPNGRPLKMVVAKAVDAAKVNLLFSTDMIEDDEAHVGQCSAVIRFDLPKTIRSYIFSRGLARQKDSQCIIMIESNWTPRPKIELLMDGMGTCLVYLDAYKKLHAIGALDDILLPHNEGSDNSATRTAMNKVNPDVCTVKASSTTNEAFRYVVKSTRALVTPESSVSLIQKYCEQLPENDDSTPRPKFELLMDGMGTCFVCLDAYKKLHAIGSLDDILLPHNEGLIKSWLLKPETHRPQSSLLRPVYVRTPPLSFVPPLPPPYYGYEDYYR